MEFKTVAALVILPVKLPFLIIGFLFKHRSLLILAGLAVVAIIAIPRVTSHKTTSQNQPEMASYQRNHPQGVPVATSSRVYYAVEYIDNGKILTLNKFYEFDGKRWVLQKQPLPLDRAVYGAILIDR